MRLQACLIKILFLMYQACSCKAFNSELHDILINYPGWFSNNMALMNLGQIK